MHLLKQSTAATDTVGPVLDSTGAEYTGAVIGDLSISKNGTEAAMAAAATLTHISNGMYTLVFTTGNTDTLGRVVVRCNKSTYQMPPVRYEVLASTTFDAIVTNAAGASGGMVYNGSNTGTVIPTVTTVTNQLTAAQVATGIWQDTTSGDFTVASSIGKSLYTTGNAPGAASGLALVGSNMGTITGALTAAQIATGVWTDTTAGDFTTALSIGKSIMNGVSLGTGLTVARCTLTDTLTTYTGNTVQTGDSYARIGAAGVGLTSVALADASSDAVIADAVWNAATASYGSAGTYGLLIETDLDATISSRGTSTLTQTQVTGGAYALNSASFAFNAALDFTTTQKAATLARVTLVDTTTLATTTTTLTNLPAITANWLTAAGIADGAIDRATFAADTGLQTIRSNTATGGGSGYILLDASASSTDNDYQGTLIRITGGTGSGQSGIINYYDATGATEGEKAAYISPTWNTNPDATSTFAITEGAADVEGFLGPRPNNSVAPTSSKTSISYPKIDIARANGTNVSATSGYLAVDTQRWTGEVIPATAQTGVPKIDVRYLLGTAWLTPAVAGTPDVNTKTFLSTLDFTATMKTSVGTVVDTSLATYDAPTHAEMTAELATADDAVLAAIAALNNLSSANVSSAVVTALTTALTEAYRTAGSTGSVAQLLYEISAHLGRSAISSVTKTTKKIDNSTTAHTFTLNDATTPTAISGPN